MASEEEKEREKGTQNNIQTLPVTHSSTGVLFERFNQVHLCLSMSVLHIIIVIIIVVLLFLCLLHFSIRTINQKQVISNQLNYNYEYINTNLSLMIKLAPLASEFTLDFSSVKCHCSLILDDTCYS